MVVAAAAAVAGKECTNIPTQLSSHTVRARLQAAPGAPQWRWRELFHDHLNPTDEAAWMDLMPPRGLRAGAVAGEEEFDWVMLYRSLKGQGGVSASAASGDGESFLEEVSLHDVRLDGDDAVYGRAQRTNLEYLLLLDVDRLAWSFRKQAGLPAPGTPYGGWEGPDVELRGHFVGLWGGMSRPCSAWMGARRKGQPCWATARPSSLRPSR
uniref:Non-reducing end beta-L-arabinofuranosidase-like GH127 catalytic domain-containing protein n=1 Tax=Arundo donax TaxID=35708 RepID=A0A0A9FBN1_ARUDO